MNARDFFDLLLIVIWWYGNGFAFAWFLTPTGPNGIRTAAIFGLVGWVLGVWGLTIRQISGRFPLGLSLLIGVIPFLSAAFSASWWLSEIVLRWLGLF
jgi:hypothetical protein